MLDKGTDTALFIPARETSGFIAADQNMNFDWISRLKDWLDKPSIVRDFMLVPLVAAIVAAVFEAQRHERGWLSVLLWSAAVICGFAAAGLVFPLRSKFASGVVIDSLLAGIPVRRASGSAIMAAINRLALDAVERGEDSRSSGASPWSDASFQKYIAVAGGFIDPTCTVDPVLSRPPVTAHALSELKRWVREPLESLNGEIRGETGVGKTVLLHKLFTDLAASATSPVPMLASGANIDYNSAAFKALAASEDEVSTFVSVWLTRRGIKARHESDQAAIGRAVESALRAGEIILLLDGEDELEGKELADFVGGLLRRVPRWIVTRRHKGISNDRRTGLSLKVAWTRDEIVAHAKLRFSDRPDVVARVVPVLEHVIPLDDEAASQHWLSHPQYLREYLDAVAPRPPRPLASEADMYRLAESTAGLIESIFDRAMLDLRDADVELRTATRDEIIAALTAVALADEGSRTRPENFVADTTRPARLAAAMKALIESVSGRGLAFRRAAVREYFLAERIAHELRGGPAAWKDATALRRLGGDLWPVSRASLVDELLCHREPDANAPAALSAWLRAPSPFGSEATSEFVAIARRNLLEVWLRADPLVPAREGAGVLHEMDLSGIEGSGLDLRGRTLDRCLMVRATLRDAALTHARFFQCTFAGADLTRANAIGAEFSGCELGASAALPVADDMEIESVQAPDDFLETLKARGAHRKRSRYRGGFGDRFLEVQREFLGKAVDELEQAYAPAIRDAIEQTMAERPGTPVFLVDLMAGGYFERTNRLLAEYGQLHVLSIDRDERPKPDDARHKWRSEELGTTVRAGTDPADVFGLSDTLGNAFPESAGRADVIIAKKALHEIDRPLQRKLIACCGTVLRRGGHLVLFVDAPGPETATVVPAVPQEAVTQHDRLRKRLLDLDPATGAGDIARLAAESRYLGDEVGEWLFVNDWISVKDWANENLHEVTHRYFASIAELREWAAPSFGDPVRIIRNHYDINPLRFNERGVNWVLHYLARNKYSEAAIARDLTMLRAQVAGSAAFRALIDFTRTAFKKSPALAARMEALGPEQPVTRDAIEAAFKALESPETAPTFKLKCGVVVFENRFGGSSDERRLALGQGAPETRLPQTSIETLA
jgi:SAM-dependent methyltransferase